MNKSHFLFLKFLIMSIVMSFSQEKDMTLNKLYKDSEIDAIASKVINRPLVKSGNLEDLSKINSLVFGKCVIFENRNFLYDYINIDKDRLIYIEGLGINSYLVMRSQISLNYDLIFSYCFLYEKGKKDPVEIDVRSCFIVPHKNEIYGIKLNSQERWKEIEFK